jgi:ADP-ribose pyrophosphatase YjhB (NUDIX family)
MNQQANAKFNIRVYGLFVNKEDEVLLTDEFQLNTKMTKFPGGGLQFGEGTIDCLKREMQEECDQEIEQIVHFYTTDFYQKARYFKNQQLISIYYQAMLKPPVNFKISVKAFDFPELKNGNQSFRWVKIKELKADELSFPIDKHVANLLIQQTEE